MKRFLKNILPLVFLFTSIASFAQSTEAKLKKSKETAEKEIAKLNKQITENTKAKRSKTSYVALLNSRIAQRKKLIRDTDIQISITESEIAKKNKNIDEIRQQINRLKESYSELVVNIYTNRKKATWLMYVFASEDFSQAYRRLKYLQSYADVVFVQAKKIEQTNQQLAKELALLSDKKQELDNYKSERKQEIESLANDEEDAKKVLKGLKNEEAKLKKQLQRRQNDLAALNKKLEELVKKELAKDKSTGFSKSPENVKLSANFAANRGRLPWPVKQGKVVSFFGSHSVSDHVQLDNRTIDISTAESENVLAVFDGVVTNVFPAIGMNLGVLLKHGEYFTLYCRLGRVNVKAGDVVKTGTVLGKVATRNDDDGSQLNFGLWKQSNPLNPLLWLLKN
ncbi:MAG: peptidoglycan DD-metalloendopeptidase family protein [Prevotellaceae bacterium]|jgi:septal ring factor EnvC (AmiA/AmiB activator)|nr:peptidoglycan DD-metalloendopeptidase family protein [Prevotellaceae bacterium]